MASLADIALLRPLGAAYLIKLEARCSFVRHEANELIIDFDDLSSDVYFVLSGKMRILYRAGTGREVILGELGAGATASPVRSTATSASAKPCAILTLFGAPDARQRWAS